jgi:hypothetical protein
MFCPDFAIYGYRLPKTPDEAKETSATDTKEADNANDNG